jgi:tetrapyrrole methylase family protein/MazG family protein
MGRITIIGLGPGEKGYLTLDAWESLIHAREILLRTQEHPVVSLLPANINIHLFDREVQEQMDVVNKSIVDEVIRLGERKEGIVYAVPGDPLFGEITSQEILKAAEERGIPVDVIHGVSFLEPVCSAIGNACFPEIILIDALEFGHLHVPNFPTNIHVVITQINTQIIAHKVKTTLLAIYPDTHPVKFVNSAGSVNEIVEELLLKNIDKSEDINTLSSLYVPPLEKGSSFEEFHEIVAHLRAPDGCPWDRKQTHASLRNNLLEETYEIITAIDEDDKSSLKEELGDLLLLILLQAQIAADEEEFNIINVIQGINRKIVRRHPHVFGDLIVDGEEEILENWERIKEKERSQNGKSKSSLLDGVSVILPALIQAQAYQQRAAHVGFEWESLEDVMNKIDEELLEVRNAKGKQRIAEEIGDLLFAIVNLARWFGIDAENALRAANKRFRDRFYYIEKEAKKANQQISDYSLEEMLKLWADAKNF